MAGSAAVCPEFQYLHAGLGAADSYCFNPHKWLLTNFDCDCFFVADRQPLIAALTVLPPPTMNEILFAKAVPSPAVRASPEVPASMENV